MKPLFQTEFFEDTDKHVAIRDVVIWYMAGKGSKLTKVLEDLNIHYLQRPARNLFKYPPLRITIPSYPLLPSNSLSWVTLLQPWVDCA